MNFTFKVFITISILLVSFYNSWSQEIRLEFYAEYPIGEMHKISVDSMSYAVTIDTLTQKLYKTDVNGNTTDITNQITPFNDKPIQDILTIGLDTLLLGTRGNHLLLSHNGIIDTLDHEQGIYSNNINSLYYKEDFNRIYVGSSLNAFNSNGRELDFQPVRRNHSFYDNGSSLGRTVFDDGFETILLGTNDLGLVYRRNEERSSSMPWYFLTHTNFHATTWAFIPTNTQGFWDNTTGLVADPIIYNGNLSLFLGGSQGFSRFGIHTNFYRNYHEAEVVTKMISHCKGNTITGTTKSIYIGNRPGQIEEDFVKHNYGSDIHVNDMDIRDNQLFVASNIGIVVFDIVSLCDAGEIEAIYPTSCLNIGDVIGITDLGFSVNNTEYIYKWYLDGNPINNYPGIKRSNNVVQEHGIYSVKVTTCSGCTDEIFFDARNLVDLGDDKSICDGDIVELSNSSQVIGDYYWQDGSMNETYTVDSPGEYWLQITTPDCVYRDTILVQYNNPLDLDLGADQVLCQEPIPLSAPFDQNASYKWQDGTTDFEYLAQSSGEYWVEMTLNDCIISDTINLSQGDIVDFTLGDDEVICFGEKKLLGVPFNSSHTYIWQDGSTDSEFLVQSPGEYWLDITSSTGCLTSDTVSLSYTNDISFQITQDRDLCTNTSIELTAPFNELYQYEWSTGEQESKINIVNSGQYWATITYNGCKYTDTIEVVDVVLPDIDLGEDFTICDDDQRSLDVPIGNYNVLWNTGSTDNQIMVDEPGIYSVVITRGDCTSSDSILIKRIERIDFNLEASYTICNNESFLLPLEFTPETTYYLNGIEISTEQSLNEARLYDLMAINECFNETSTFQLNTKQCECIIHLPDVVTLNQNNLNDKFKILSYCEFESFNLTIFNRWGEAVFVSTNSTFEWPNTDSLFPQSGIYLYSIKATTQFENIEMTGSINIIK